MNNNREEHVESDEHDEEEIDDNDVEEDFNQHVEDEEEQSNHPQDEDEEEPTAQHRVDRTNPLDEDSDEAAQNLTQEDVFGGELSDLSDDDEGRRRERRENDLDEHQHDEELLDEQHEEDEEEQILVDAPNVTCDLGRDIHLVKLPSFMKIETKPFDPSFYNDEIRDDDDEDSKARFKLQLENTIRWRYATNESGDTIRESNTRLVRWSDGSLSLHVGKEIFDVSKANIQSDHNHLFVRHQKSMQAQAVFRTKLSFRQHSNDSLAHLKIKFASKANPAPKVRVLSNIKATISNSAEMIKREEQRMRAEERRRNQQLRQRERAAYRDRNMSASYLEDRDEDEDNEQVSINAIKQNAKKKKLQGNYRDEDMSEQEEEEEEEEEEEAEEEEDDDGDEKLIGQRSSTSTKHRKVSSSDEDDNDQQDVKRKRDESEDEE